MNDLKIALFSSVIEFSCYSPLHPFVHELRCPSLLQLRAVLTFLSSSRTSTLVLGIPTCLYVIPTRYSAAALNKYSITNCETVQKN